MYNRCCIHCDCDDQSDSIYQLTDRLDLYGSSLLIYPYRIDTYGYYVHMGDTDHAGGSDRRRSGHDHIYCDRYAESDDSGCTDSYLCSITYIADGLYSRCTVHRDDDSESKSNDNGTRDN